MRIRRIGIEDLNASVADCILDVWSDVNASLGAKTSLIQVVEDNKKVFARVVDPVLLIAESDDKVVGFRFGHRLSHSAQMVFYDQNGGTRPTFRRQGVSSLLIQEQHRTAVELGYTAVVTDVALTLKPMIILNLKLGFDIAGIHRDSTFGIDVLRFSKAIGPSRA